MGETYFLSTMAAMLSRIVRDLGRDDEALDLLATAEAAAAADDVDAQALWRSIRAPILARTGDLAGAEALAGPALDLSRAPDAPALLADTLSELATVLMPAGRIDDARDAISEAAIALYAGQGRHRFSRAIIGMGESSLAGSGSISR